LIPGIGGLQRIESSALFDEDSIGGLGPDEGLGMGIDDVLQFV
jgi:hypothetical protein